MDGALFDSISPGARLSLTLLDVAADDLHERLSGGLAFAGDGLTFAFLTPLLDLA